MPLSSHPQRPVSRTLAPALSVVADAVTDYIDDAGVRAVGTAVGASKSAVHQWGPDLSAWPASALLILAGRVPDIGEAIVALITGATPAPAVPTAAISEAYETAREASALITELMTAVEDGRFDRIEGRRLDQKIDTVVEVLARLKRDVKAAAR